MKNGRQHLTRKIVIPAEPLDAAEFEEFGEVISHYAEEGRHFIETAFEINGLAASPRLWVNVVPATLGPEVSVTYLERHPHSAQSFIPLGFASCIAIVSPAGQDGRPDIASMRAFVLGPGQGICYRRGTWHHGFVSMRRRCDVAVIMALTDQADDTEVETIRSHVRVLVS